LFKVFVPGDVLGCLIPRCPQVLSQASERRIDAKLLFSLEPPENPSGAEKELGQAALLLAAGKSTELWNWSTGSRTRTDFPAGSQFFLVRTGSQPRGVIGYGTIPTGELYPGRRHTDPSREITYIDIDLEKLIDSERYPEKVVSLDFLEAAGFGFQVCNPRGSGTEIPDQAAAQIKAAFDSRQGELAPTIKELLEADPHLGMKDLGSPEGRLLIKNHLVRERNPALVKKKKRAVLSTTGTLACEVCRFDFSAKYGELGRGFAECHHLTPLALLAKTRATKLEDLAIVCANCHRMLHRGIPWKTIAELKDILQASQRPRG
jgi:hypothetical protein